MKNDFREIAALFLKYNVFLETAVTMAIRCLAKPDEYVQMFGNYVWGKPREKPRDFFEKFRVEDYYHAAKWGTITQNNTAYTDFFLSTSHSIFVRTS